MDELTGVIEIDPRNQIRIRAATLLRESGIDIRRWYRKDGTWYPTRMGIWVRKKDVTMLATAVSRARAVLNGPGGGTTA